jgi:hypothetical protein
MRKTQKEQLNLVKQPTAKQDDSAVITRQFIKDTISNIHIFNDNTKQLHDLTKYADFSDLTMAKAYFDCIARLLKLKEQNTHDLSIISPEESIS